jgi:hypothetical protein
MRSYATQVNKKQPGDPVKLAQAFVKLANAEKPPVHLPLGSDTLAMYMDKAARLEQDIEQWYEVITGN